MTRGGARPGAGRKKLPEDVKRNKYSIYCTKNEILKIREFLKSLRNKCIILFFIFFVVSPCTFADSFKMSAPSRDSYNWDIKDLQYETRMEHGVTNWENRHYVFAKTLGVYKNNGEYKDTSNMPIKNWVGWKYYVVSAHRVDCYYAYENTLASFFKHDKVNNVTSEYVPVKGWKGVPILVAIYKPVDAMEFLKYDAQGNLVSIFSRRNNSLKYWYEYKPDGKTIITKHNTDFIPYQPVKYER